MRVSGAWDRDTGCVYSLIAFMAAGSACKQTRHRYCQLTISRGFAPRHVPLWK